MKKNVQTSKMISSTDDRDYEEVKVRSQHKGFRGEWVVAEIALAMVTEMVFCEDTMLKAKLSKKGDITLPKKVCLVKTMAFSAVMYGCET